MLKLSAPTSGGRVSILGVNVSGEADGALAEEDIPTQEPHILAPGQVPKTVYVEKWVAMFPVITVSLQSVANPGAPPVTQSAAAQRGAGLSGTFSLHMKPPSTGRYRITVVADIPGDNSEARQSIQVDVFDPRTEVAPAE
jgi:hypothetical protein